MRTDQEDVYTYSRVSSALEKEILSYATRWTNLQDIMLNEISQSQKDKHCVIPLYGVSKVVKLTETQEWWLPEAEQRGLWDVVQ